MEIACKIAVEFFSSKPPETKSPGVGIFGFADMVMFWFSFSVFALKHCGLTVLVSCLVCGFSPI